VYIWSGMGPIVWSGHTWKGAGLILSISALEEGSTVEARGITLSLSGIDTTLLPIVLEDYKLGGAVTVYLAAFDSSGVIVADPIPAWGGRMDHPNVKIDGRLPQLTSRARLDC